jgi:Antitoxin Phd_YefM, type II toxin-antitoxin system
MLLDFELISMTELRNKPGEIFDNVSEGGKAFIVERNGKRAGCLVPLSVFFPDIAPSRIAEEIEQLSQHNETLSTDITDSKEIAFRFTHTLSNNSPIGLTIILPQGYPNTCPRVYADISDEAVPHRWKDGALCMYGVMTGWNPGKHTVFSTLQLARVWLKHYESWKETGTWNEKEGAKNGQ